ncbi:MAG TPA: hypothetical protein VL442_12375 [Mucilaginibacter sp.]|nr:hypothetical protein [Mucilaginibacter sp.]
MRTKDRIWALVAKRLAKEATITELQELNKLLKKSASIDWQIKIIADWWKEDIQEEIAEKETRLFQKIKGKIKVNED